MVKIISSLTGNGVADWSVQRVSAVVLALYTLFMVAFLLSVSEFTYDAWAGLFAPLWMKLFTLLAILAFAGHAWVGLWTVTTDYLHRTTVRVSVQLAVALVLFIYFVVAFDAVWGV